MRAAMAAYRTGILRFNSGTDAAARSPLMAVFIAGALVPLEPQRLYLQWVETGWLRRNNPSPGPLPASGEREGPAH
jgi:hypothetical protein